MLTPPICGVVTDLDNCLAPFDFEGLRFFLYEACWGSRAESVPARSRPDVAIDAGTASLVTPVTVRAWDITPVGPEG